MARRNEWAKYQSLRDTIEDAICDAMCDFEDDDQYTPEDYLIFISRDLENAVCFLDADDATQFALIQNYDEWFCETATNYEDAINVADNYFDLR